MLQVFNNLQENTIDTHNCKNKVPWLNTIPLFPLKKTLQNSTPNYFAAFRMSFLHTLVSINFSVKHIFCIFAEKLNNNIYVVYNW